MNARVEINVTRRCNKSCSFCYIKQKEIDINPSVIKKFINKYRPLEVILTGGEPLLHPKIFEIIRFIRSKNITVAIFTNCLALNKKTIKRIKKHQVRIQASYHQHDPKILLKLKAAKKLGIHILTSTIFLRETLKDLNQILKDLRPFDTNAFLFPIPINRNPLSNLISGVEWIEMTELLLKKSKKFGNNVYYELAYINKTDEIPKELRCSAGREDVIFVDSDGKRIPCCLMSDLFENKKIKFKIPSCQICGGGCTALDMVYGHDPRCNDKFTPICPLLLVNNDREKFTDKNFTANYFRQWKKEYMKNGLKERRS